MNLNCETILDFYTHKNKKILCQIKVASSKRSKFNNNNTCRCLKQEQWNTFDKELEKCITDNDDDWNDEKCLEFKIEPCIEVKVQKSKLSLKYFYKCLDAKDDYDKVEDAGGVGGDGVDIIEANYVLQCLLKFHETPFDVGRYEPLNETDTDVLSSRQLSCQLYTPTKKRYRADNIDTVKTPGIELLEYNEDECSTNLKTCNNSEQPQLSEIISNNTSELVGSSDEVIVETGDEIDSPKINRFKKSKKLESAFTSNSQETNVADLPAHRKGDSSERTVSKTDHDIRKHRKRTKTIDVVPNILDDNSKDKHKTKKERSSSRDKHSHKLSKKRSKTIDEVPPGSSLNNEKSTLKNWTDENKEKSCKKFEFTDKHKSHKTEDSKEKSCAKSESSDKHKSHKSEYMKENKHKKVDDSERSTSHKSEESKEKSIKKLDSSEKGTSHKSEESKEKQYKNKSEYIKEKTHKKLDDTEKSTSHKSEESREKPKKKLDSTDKGTSLKSEESKENRHKKLDCNEQTTSHKSKEKKKDLNENITSTKEKKHERRISNLSSSEDDFLIAFIKSKTDKKTSEVEDSDDEFEENKVDKNEKLSPSNDNTSNLNISISSATESNTDTSPNKTTKRGRKKKETNSDANIFVRRSERSPTKPYRFIDEQHILLKSNRVKKNKTSPKNKELFGTDDDDEENYFEKKTNSQNKDKSSIFETPVSKKSSKSASSSSSSSTKKKRKRDKSSECEQEKRAMGNWLSKKKSSSSDIEEKKASTSKSSSSSSSKSRPLKTTKTEKSQNIENDTDSHAKSVTPASSFELPSKEEIELIKNKTKLMQKENAILKAQLEKMRTSPPKEVEFKSLHDIPLDEILNTFSIYQTDLDEIYKNNCKRDYIKGHEGINHCFVIQLLPQNIQMKMLEKLTDVYSNTKSSTQATLYANALLPEWVLRVYMEKFKLNRQEAIHHIKAQEEYRLHVEEQSDNSFMFD